MNKGEAYRIFRNLTSDEYTFQEKGTAIYIILHLETMNGITKVELVNALLWLWSQNFEVGEEDA
jgi:hypothetical protein